MLGRDARNLAKSRPSPVERRADMVWTCRRVAVDARVVGMWTAAHGRADMGVRTPHHTCSVCGQEEVGGIAMPVAGSVWRS